MSVLRASPVFLASMAPLFAAMLVGILATPAFARQGAKSQQAPHSNAQPRRSQPQQRGNGQLKPGPQLLNKLAQMTPEEREKALSRLPPAQRANLERQIRNFQQLPPAAQERRLDRAERLNNLPPQEQTQVRRSANQLKNLPEDRRMAVNKELRRLSLMPDDERQAYMDTEEFRNRFSPDEQRIVGNLAKILPPREQ